MSAGSAISSIRGKRRRPSANLTGALNETNARITASELPVVRIRETHFAQLFQNLIGNALKYRKDEITPEVRVQERSVDIQRR